MAHVGVATEAGHARYTYRLRVSSAARTAFAAEWDRCRWVWNECVAKCKAVYLHNKATGGKQTCGPALLDRMLTEARRTTPWLRKGSSVVQQQSSATSAAPAPRRTRTCSNACRYGSGPGCRSGGPNARRCRP